MSPDLVVLSHLRWTFVWQRPQHLISRLSERYQRTWFVEEPEVLAGLSAPVLRVQELEQVTRVWLEVPPGLSGAGFDAVASEYYSSLLIDLIGTRPKRTAWLYTPMALDVARRLRPSVLVYDVMDDLAAFRFAPPGLVLRQRQALREADIVFTGGRSLHRSVLEHRAVSAHCFPSGVEPEHYEPAIAQRHARQSDGRRVAGYVGVIDERIDLDLVAGLAAELPDWEIRMVGPVVKIDPATLPRAANITYPGARLYSELPLVMAGFDVGLMPFAANEATRSISPTKTLEYLASGLPVVSTPVPDVVADYSGIVTLGRDAAGLADACRAAVVECPQARAERIRPVLRNHHWDTIARAMQALVDGIGESSDATQESA